MYDMVETGKFLVGLAVMNHEPKVMYPATVAILHCMGGLGFGTIENFGYVLAQVGIFALLFSSTSCLISIRCAWAVLQLFL